jgi:predicted signal transduction protein with EAL and GGDEF domain
VGDNGRDGDQERIDGSIDRVELVSEIERAFGAPPAGLLLIDLQTPEQADVVVDEAEPGDRVLVTGPTSRAIIRAAITAPAEADGLALRLHSALTEPVLVEGRQVSREAAIGVATSLDGDTAEQLLRYAEHGLDDAAMLGGNRVVVFDDEDRQLLLP